MTRMKEVSRKRFGYHVVYDADICDAIDFADTQSFGYIVPDLMIPRFFPERFTQSERRHIRKVAASKDVSISFHGPSDYLNIGTLYPEVKRSVLSRMKMCIDFARDVEAERFTIHIDPPYDFVFAGREGTFLRDHWMTYKNSIRQSLVELAEYTRREVLLCVENDRLTRLGMEVLEELLRQGNLFLAWDLPKSHSTNGRSIVEVENFLLSHLDEVKECHVHDQKAGTPSHDVVGVGNIDFSHYLGLLLPRDVRFTLEIRPREKALESLTILVGMVEGLGWKVSALSGNSL